MVHSWYGGISDPGERSSFSKIVWSAVVLAYQSTGGF